jgi:hypothetical protein
MSDTTPIIPTPEYRAAVLARFGRLRTKNPAYITLAEVAGILGITTNSMSARIHRGTFPFHPEGYDATSGTAYYDRESVLAWAMSAMTRRRKNQDMRCDALQGIASASNGETGIRSHCMDRTDDAGENRGVAA